jgi:hypothetical protein
MYYNAASTCDNKKEKKICCKGRESSIHNSFSVVTQVTFPVPRRVVLLVGRAKQVVRGENLAAACCRHFVLYWLLSSYTVCVYKLYSIIYTKIYSYTLCMYVFPS